MRGVTLTVNLKGKLAVAVCAMAVAAFAGGAYAATQESAPGSRQAFLGDVAKRLHVTPAQLSAALKGAALDQVNAAVAAGRLTKAQGDALKQAIEKGGAPQLPGGALGLRGLHGPLGLRGLGGLSGTRAHRFPGHPWLFHRFMRPGAPGPGWRAGPAAAAHGPLGAAAAYLGLSRAQLFEQMGSGKSLADIAKSRGKSVSGLKQAIGHSLAMRRFSYPPRGKVIPRAPGPKGSSAGASGWIPAPSAGPFD